MGSPKADLHDSLKLRRTFGGFDDFHHYTSGGAWTSTVEGSASITVGDAANGILTLAAIDSTDNRELYLKSTNEVFLFAEGIMQVFECRLKFTEANVSAANVGFGVANAVGNDLLVDGGGGMKTSGSFAAIYKVDGGTVWKTASSVGSTQNLSTSTKTAGGSAYQILRIEVCPISSTIAEVTYYVNDVQLLMTGGRPGQNLIKDQLTYTSATEMQLFVALKNGSTSPESVLVDYIAWEQQRGTLY